LYLHTRRISDPELLSHEVRHHHRHVQRILQKRPGPSHGNELETEPELHTLTTTALDQGPVLVVQKEGPLQVRTRPHPSVPAVGRRLISQELHRHAPQNRTD
jgi:hypothetical protein